MRTATKIPGFRYAGTTFEPAFVTEDGRIRIRQVTPRKWVVQSGGVEGFEVAGRDAAIREARRLASEAAAENVRVLEAGMKTLSRHHSTKKTPRAQLNREIAEVLARKGKRHHSTISDGAKIRDAIARFPPTFGLRGFPGDVFRLSPTSSYVSGGSVMLYTQRKEGDHWLDFSKGTEPELRGEIVPLPSANGRTARSHASRPDRNIIVRPTSTRWPGGVKVRVVKFGADVRQGVRAVMPVGSLAVMHPDAGEKLPDGTVRVHEDYLHDTAD
jgi:hypothetical protein